MSIITILLCSRSRPENLQRMINSACCTADDPMNIEFFIRLDNDDPKLIDYAELEYERNSHREYLLGPREGNIKPYNRLIKNIFKYSKKAPIAVMIGADDIVFRTNGWDTGIRNLDEIQKTYLAWFADGKANSICASHPVISREFAQKLDYELLDHDYICFKADQHLTDVAKQANVSFFMREWLVEHMHPKYDKAEWDDTYLENRPDYCVDIDQETFDKKEELRKEQVRKLLNDS